jgi:hypothetical protein
MKKLMSITLIGILVASFAIGGMVATSQAKPLVGVCYTMCNRTTYQLLECCPYIVKGSPDTGEIVYKCKMIGWCYPE